MSNELQPCPFCGSTDLHEYDQEGIAWVGCNNCNAEGPTTELLWEARVVWNERQ